MGTSESGTPFETIILVVDGTESSLRAAEVAFRVARTHQSRVAAVSVVDTETLRLLLTQRILVSDEMDELHEDLEASSRKYLSHVAELGRKAGVEVETVLRQGSFHSAILAEQKSREADLIVMGPIQYTLTRRDLVVRERHLIADEATCHVLLVK